MNPVRTIIAKELYQDLSAEAMLLHNLSNEACKRGDMPNANYYGDRWDFALRMRDDVLADVPKADQPLNWLERTILAVIRLFRR